MRPALQRSLNHCNSTTPNTLTPVYQLLSDPARDARQQARLLRERGIGMSIIMNARQQPIEEQRIIGRCDRELGALGLHNVVEQGAAPSLVRLRCLTITTDEGSNPASSKALPSCDSCPTNSGSKVVVPCSVIDIPALLGITRRTLPAVIGRAAGSAGSRQLQI